MIAFMSSDKKIHVLGFFNAFHHAQTLKEEERLHFCNNIDQIIFILLSSK